MQYLIETKGTPPERIGRPPVYPWGQMHVNNSCFFKLKEGDTLDNMRARLGTSIRNFIKGTDKRFTTRQEDGGLRVWRVK